MKIIWYARFKLRLKRLISQDQIKTGEKPNSYNSKPLYNKKKQTIIYE